MAARHLAKVGVGVRFSSSAQSLAGSRYYRRTSQVSPAAWSDEFPDERVQRGPSSSMEERLVEAQEAAGSSPAGHTAEGPASDSGRRWQRAE